MDIFAYLVERVEDGCTMKILISDWASVLDCLSKLKGTSDEVSIHRMPICSKDDPK